MDKAIVIFAYDRPNTLRLVIDQLLLQKNEICEDIDIFVYQDVYKDGSYNEEIELLCESRNLKVIRRNFNYGLRDNIVSALNDVFRFYRYVMVLEDDVVPKMGWLKFMLDMDVRYFDDMKVGHVSSWLTPPLLPFVVSNKHMKVPFMECWGWGTWNYVWNEHLGKEWVPNVDIDWYGAFNYQEQLKLNSTGEIRSWAVYWQVYLRNNSLQSVAPLSSLVWNMGMDGKGTFSGTDYHHSIRYVWNRSHIALNGLGKAIFLTLTWLSLQIRKTKLGGLYRRIVKFANENSRSNTNIF